MYEYLAALAGDSAAVIKVLPRFVVDEKGEYIIGVVMDEDGDITEYVNVEAAVRKVFNITPKRLDKLKKEFQEAAKQIVNPTSEGG